VTIHTRLKFGEVENLNSNLVPYILLFLWLPIKLYLNDTAGAILFLYKNYQFPLK